MANNALKENELLLFSQQIQALTLSNVLGWRECKDE